MYWDIKTEPKTELEVWDRWCNYLEAILVSSFGKKVEVK